MALPRRSLPLPITASVIALLLLGPTLALRRLPRPQAQGLEQLMDSASLLQSFAATPQRPVPALWTERIGQPLAAALWRQQRRTWWQFWGPHADGAPYLAVSVPGLPPRAPLPATALRAGDLLVFSPDPLSRQLLADRLRPGKRPSRGLQRRCLSLIEQEQAVFWNPSALGVIVGPLAPLLQPFQAGCLSLQLGDGSLRWQGEAAAVDGVLAASGSPASTGPAESFAPLPAEELLEIRGGSLDPLLQGLLSRQLIRDPLARRYGIRADQLALLRHAPFRLRLRPRPSGPYQASLELQLITAGRPDPWRKLLAGVAAALSQQGLRQAPEGAASDAKAAARGVSTASEGASWVRPDGQVLGGWRWISGPQAERQLLLFLGPLPPSFAAIQPGVAERPPAGDLLLRLRPQALDRLGLLPPDMPPLVRRADQLAIRTQPLPEATGPSQPISRLTGALQLSR